MKETTEKEETKSHLMMNKPGIIALDIDGTITTDSQPPDLSVIDFFDQLSKEGWIFIFISGRTIACGHRILKHLPFAYYFAAHNGAIIQEMPSKKAILQNYLTLDILDPMDNICRGSPSDYIIFTSDEKETVCYYRPQYFSSEFLNYVENRGRRFQEKWIPLSSYRLLPIKSFPSIKWFGPLEKAERIADLIEIDLKLHAPCIKDPFEGDFYVVQATTPTVSKATALQKIKEILGKETVLTIAAGDDNNDKSMLEIADIKIVMATAAQEMLAKADIIASPATEMGIISALKQAIQK